MSALECIATAALWVAEKIGLRLLVHVAERGWHYWRDRNVTTNTPEYTEGALALTAGQVAARLGMKTEHVCRLFERNLVPQVPRVGRQRAIPESHIPLIKDAARKAGYLKG